MVLLMFRIQFALNVFKEEKVHGEGVCQVLVNDEGEAFGKETKEYQMN